MVAERAAHTTAEQVRTTCSFARAERLLGREYHGRFLIELLQNAADAWRVVATPGARSHLSIVIAPGPALVVANQGNTFPSKVVIESIGHIGVSTKARGEAIGHKGIGFKAVLARYAKRDDILVGTPIAARSAWMPWTARSPGASRAVSRRWPTARS